MTDRALLLDALLVDPGKAALVSREDREALVRELAALTMVLLTVPTHTADATVTQTPAPAGPRLLTLEETAGRIRKSKRWLLDNWRHRLPFGRKVGRTLLFPEAEVERWVKRA